jgi:hypothetical protein
MDWHEAFKWIGILVAAGLISTAIELVLEYKVFNPQAANIARAEARAEVDRIMTAAVKQSGFRASSVSEPKFVAPQNEASKLVYHV